MKSSPGFAVIFLGLSYTAFSHLAAEEELEAFRQFTIKHGREYATSDEEALRFENFRGSLETVRMHNANPGRTFTMAINQFSDMSDEEFEREILMDPQNCSATVKAPSRSVRAVGAGLPAHVDWREKGIVSEVKNQGQCGSCWTFSTVGCLEAHLAILYDAWRAPRLSEQQLVDCAQAFDNHGCNGGLPSHAFEYIRAAGGLDTEFVYPYSAKDGQCLFNSSARQSSTDFMPTSKGVGAMIPGGSVNLTAGDEAELKHYLATRGPVSVAFQVASDFRHYSHGVYTSSVCKSAPSDVNHAVLAVGYGTDPDSGLQYWTIKNSWDYTWGKEGYFKIEAFKNMCGVADCMSFPDLYGINEAESRARDSPILV